MAWKTLKLRLSGNTIILHNGQLANPLNKFAKALKAVSSKKTKTDADFEQMAKIEFKGGLYMNENGPCLTPEAIEATVIAGARKTKDGKVAASGILVTKTADLEYEGPRTVDELWEDENFRLVVGVKIGKSRVMRTRPIFRNWKATVEIEHEDTVANESTVMEWVRRAGAESGICDWRPKHGRFVVEQVA